MESMKQSPDRGKAIRSSKSRGPEHARLLMPDYRVGELLHPGRYSWPEGAQFSHGQSGYELTLIRSNLNRQLIHDVSGGQIEFALIADLPVIVLAYRFRESVWWDDVPYCWHLQPATQRVLPALAGSVEARAFLWMNLVSATDGRIKAQRGLTLSPDFSRVLNATVRAQAMMQFKADECVAAISRIYLACGSSTNPWSSAVARTIGNK
jgi:hypothetical protein